MYYVADTHALAWYFTDSPQLSRNAREVFDSAEKGGAVIIIPAIVLLECIDIAEKKKVPIDFEELILKITQGSNFLVSETTLGIITETSRVKGFKDLHDRVIVATAQLYDAHLISKDSIIRKLYKKTVW